MKWNAASVRSRRKCDHTRSTYADTETARPGVTLNDSLLSCCRGYCKLHQVVQGAARCLHQPLLFVVGSPSIARRTLCFSSQSLIHSGLSFSSFFRNSAKVDSYSLVNSSCVISTIDGRFVSGSIPTLSPLGGCGSSPGLESRSFYPCSATDRKNVIRLRI